MLPWIIGTVMATALFSEEDEEEEEARRKMLGLDRSPKEVDPQRKREMSFLDIWGGASPDPLWTVETGDGYVAEIHTSESNAIRSAKRASKEDEGAEEIQVVKHVKIPIGLWEDLQLFGTKESPFSDGYEASSTLSPYESKETRGGIVFSWSLYDEDFKDWPSEKKKEERENTFSESKASSDLPQGTKLYLLVEDDEPWFDEIEQHKKEEETGEDAETNLVDPLFASNSPATAPVFPGTAYEGRFLVTMQLEQPIPEDRVIFVPWSDLQGSSQRKIEDLSRVLEICVDPKDIDFDPEGISNNLVETRREDRKHWGPVALQIQTDDQGSFLLFFWPYPQEERLANKFHVRVKVLSVEKV